MRNVTINIPNVYLEIIQKLKKAKKTDSVSAFLRDSIKKFLENEWEFLKLLEVEVKA